MRGGEEPIEGCGEKDETESEGRREGEREDEKQRQKVCLRVSV